VIFIDILRIYDCNPRIGQLKTACISPASEASVSLWDQYFASPEKLQINLHSALDFSIPQRKTDVLPEQRTTFLECAAEDHASPPRNQGTGGTFHMAISSLSKD